MVCNGTWEMLQWYIISDYCRSFRKKRPLHSLLFNSAHIKRCLTKLGKGHPSYTPWGGSDRHVLCDFDAYQRIHLIQHLIFLLLYRCYTPMQVHCMLLFSIKVLRYFTTSRCSLCLMQLYRRPNRLLLCLHSKQTLVNWQDKKIQQLSCCLQNLIVGRTRKKNSLTWCPMFLRSTMPCLCFHNYGSSLQGEPNLSLIFKSLIL